ncbi:hypothetical protein KL918_001657 [Ogataea parapolymorpha]|uniref:Protein ste16 n=1 Tax=Ogataea parapolymorpha (strain ATCC 26012 / BCRC 20466 / JCM 22074 / NRRL Y-7560 / DL-1) TaxID=871575 RepID=W1QEH2_OGAPD|nr:Protein ste16 [Ogataea parapolymorpha DL-1]ESW99412.1 Protein ste16 [Ogataea parapolymorpha DL-1]KAG7869014.1 hypothetical protein KL918_001657 [Ogataea parapolymorpha]KAG7874095.1 hypothetical protein KL916_001869 [Ogataea parapolymorpha]
MSETAHDAKPRLSLNARKVYESIPEDTSKATILPRMDSTGSLSQSLGQYPSFVSMDRKDSQRKKLAIPEFESTRNRGHSNSAIHSVDSATSLSSISIREADESTFADQTQTSRFTGDKVSPTWALSDILQVLSDKNTSSEDIVDKTNDMVDLLEENDSLRNDLVFSSVIHVVQRLMLQRNEMVVACGYRILWYVVTDLRGLQLFFKYDLYIFVIASLSKDSKHTTERSECIRLIRRLVSIEGGPNEFPIALVRSLINIVEDVTDPLRTIAFETVVEIALLDPERAYKANALGVLLQYIVDGPAVSRGVFCEAILKLLDLPNTRPYIIKSQLVQLLISPFMDISHIKTENLQVIAHLIVFLLKNWSGLIAFSQHDFLPIRELISCLTFSSVSIKSILLQIFSDLFRIKPMSLNDTNDENGPMIVPLINSERQGSLTKPTTNARSSPETESSLVNHYTMLLLHICIRCGLVEKLKKLFEEVTDKKLNKRIMVLLSEISYMQSFLVPDQLIKSIAPSFELNKQIEKYLRNHHNSNLILTEHVHVKLSEQVFKDLRLKMLCGVDATQLKTLVSDTHVLATKDYYKWNWSLITELMQGPLRDSRNFEETVRTTKFYKRLMSFYRPFKYRFASLRKTKSNLVFVKVGCEIFKNLLSNAEGVKYLTENKVLPQIAECLAQVDPYSGITAGDPLFSKTKLETTLSYGYFSFLGVLSADPNGLRMLEQWWFFDMLYHITDQKAHRPDLVKIIIKEMKYNSNSHMRIILSKVASTSSPSLRLFSVRLLGNLLENEECESFACRLLVGQLCDPEENIRQLSVELLTSFAKDEEKVLEIIKYRPSIGVLETPSGINLMLKILATGPGFEYLQEYDFVDEEMEAWIQSKNKHYVQHIETYLAQKLFNEKAPNELPYHFFGGLVRTTDGLRLFEVTGTFDSFSRVVNSYANLIQTGQESEFYYNTPCSEQEDYVTDLKSVLWAIGHIGSSDRGVCLLDMTGVVNEIVSICVKSQNASIRGTCFLVLGLISQTDLGSEMLDDVGWFTKTASNGYLGLCLPKKLESLVDLDTHEDILADLSRVPNSTTMEEFDRIMDQDYLPFHSREKLLKRTDSSGGVGGATGPGPSSHSANITKEYQTLKQIYRNLLLLPVNQGKAVGNLNRLKSGHPRLFESEPVVMKLIIEVLENYRIKFNVKRFLLGELVDLNSLMEALLKHNRRKLKEQGFLSGGVSGENSKSAPNISMARGSSNRHPVLY